MLGLLWAAATTGPPASTTRTRLSPGWHRPQQLRRVALRERTGGGSLGWFERALAPGFEPKRTGQPGHARLLQGAATGGTRIAPGAGHLADQRGRAQHDGRTQLRFRALFRGPCVLAAAPGGCARHARSAQTCGTDRRKTRRQCRRHSLCSAPEDGISAGEDRRPRGSRTTMNPSNHSASELDRGCGDRLRKAREAAGLRCPTSREAEDADPGDRIARIRRMDEGRCDRVRVASCAATRGCRASVRRYPGGSAKGQISPPHRPMTYTPPLRARRKAMGRMVYIVITALIAVPVWMATRGTLWRDADGIAFDIRRYCAGSGVERGAEVREAGVSWLRWLRSPTRSPVNPRWPCLAPTAGWGSSTATASIEQACSRRASRDFDDGAVGRVVLAMPARSVPQGHVQDLSAFRRADVARFGIL